MLELEKMMHCKLKKVKRENDGTAKKTHYVSQNLDLLNKLKQLRKEHDDLTKESSVKDKERKKCKSAAVSSTQWNPWIE